MTTSYLHKRIKFLEEENARLLRENSHLKEITQIMYDSFNLTVKDSKNTMANQDNMIVNIVG